MTQTFRVTSAGEYRKAGPTDLVELNPVPGGHPLYVAKWLLEALVGAIVKQELVHLSGPTGSAKSSLIETLNLGAGNFHALCRALDVEPRPLRLYPIEMAVYEAPGELYCRRALHGGNTYDEPSRLVLALEDAARHAGDSYPLIWLREMGRVHSASVQGGLLDLMVKGDIILPDGRRIDGRGLSWLADSNYQADQDSTHTLVTLDDALKRRFRVNLTLDYLTPEQVLVVRRLLAQATLGKRRLDADLLAQVVKLGSAVRRHRRDGNLTSLAPPTLYGYLAFLRLAQTLPHLSPQQIALVTLLGNASAEDRKLIPGVLNEVYGLAVAAGDDPAQVDNLF
jgi:hypothetical protein